MCMFNSPRLVSISVDTRKRIAFGKRSHLSLEKCIFFFFVSFGFLYCYYVIRKMKNLVVVFVSFDRLIHLSRFFSKKKVLCSELCKRAHAGFAKKKKKKSKKKQKEQEKRLKSKVKEMIIRILFFLLLLLHFNYAWATSQRQFAHLFIRKEDFAFVRYKLDGHFEEFPFTFFDSTLWDLLSFK